MAEIGNASEPQGPIGYENWKAKLAGYPAVLSEEVVLYSDARISGEVPEDLGPWVLAIVAPDAGAEGVEPVLRLRMDTYTPFSAPNFDSTDRSRYHGLIAPDEFTALLSLSLGIKLKRGGSHRYLQVEDGSVVIEEDGVPPPVLDPANRMPIVPRLLGERDIQNASLLAGYHRLAARDAVALVRAARHFQNAAWLAEGEPELAWLLLVSAVEAAAHHHATDDIPAPELLWEFKRPLAQLLQDTGGNELVSGVANMIAHALGATKKYMTFLREFLPEAPAARPEEVMQQDWRWNRLRDLLNDVYAQRSVVLHAGEPIPLPMSVPPFSQPGWDAPAEVPLQSAMSALGAVWTEEDVPMLLNTFFYVVQGALLKWWHSMTEDVAAASE